MVALILSVLLCAGGVFAWLAYNSDLDTDGMQMTATAVANLIISATNTDVAGGILDDDILHSSSPFTVHFADASAELIPCTHVNGTPLGLQYSANPEGVNYATGLGDLGLTNVPADTAGYY